MSNTQKNVEKPNIGKLLGVAQRPVFPFMLVNFEIVDEEEEEDIELTVKVSKDVYEYFQSIYGKNNIILYQDPGNGKIQSWSSDMHLSFDLLNKFGLMSDYKTWIKEAREKHNQLISKVVGDILNE